MVYKASWHRTNQDGTNVIQHAGYWSYLFTNWSGKLLWSELHHCWLGSYRDWEREQWSEVSQIADMEVRLCIKIKNKLLVACTRLYKPLCWSVRVSVCLSVCPSVAEGSEQATYGDRPCYNVATDIWMDGWIDRWTEWWTDRQIMGGHTNEWMDMQETIIFQ